MAGDPFKAGYSIDEFNNIRQNFIDNFFSKLICKYKNEWDYIIKIGRKGLFVFDDLSNKQSVTENDISSFDLPLYKQKNFEHKRILLFDDSICSSELIKSCIKTFPLSTKITIAALIANKGILDQLKDVTIITYKDFINENYDTFYYEYMPMYFEYICMPEPTSLSDEYIFHQHLTDEEIKNIFTIETRTPKKCENSFNFKDRFQMELIFNKKIIDKLLIKYNKVKSLECKIKLYIHKYATKTKIYVEYIFVPANNLSTCEKLKENCEFPYLTSCPICCNRDLADMVRNQIEENLKSKKFYFNPLPWYFMNKKL